MPYVLGVIASLELKLKKSEFSNSDCRFGLLAKKYDKKVCLFFPFSDENTVKFSVKVTKRG